MNGLLLRLAGPLQSWGERSVFTATRESAPFPTRSGLIGMFAAAEGRPRATALDDDPYAGVQFTVRADRPGTLLTDFHTAGGGRPDHLTAATSAGKHKSAAVITRRDYLTDAVFVVAVQAPDDTLQRIAQALSAPHWAPYLGRRSCVPDEPFLLRSHVHDPCHELLHHVPLSPDSAPADRTPAPPEPGEEKDEGTVAVHFYWESPHAATRQDAVTLGSYDQPVSFAQQARAHTRRTLYRTTEHLPAGLLANPYDETAEPPSLRGRGRDKTSPPTLHQRLIRYAQSENQAPV